MPYIVAATGASLFLLEPVHVPGWKVSSLTTVRENAYRFTDRGDAEAAREELQAMDAPDASPWEVIQVAD